MRIQIEDTLTTISKELVGKINHISNEIMTMIANICEEGVRQGKFVDGHGMAYADIIWGLFSGLVVWEESKRRLNPKKDFLKPTVDRAFDVFYRGIEKKL
jgi:hypothetical protein